MPLQPRLVNLVHAGQSTRSPNLRSTGHALADRAERLLRARRLRVDEDPWWNQDDVRGYADSILLHTPGSPYLPTAHHDRAAELAQVISGRIGRTFLVARLAATALTQRRELADPADPAWLAALNGDVIGVFRAALQRAFPSDDARLRAVELLRAVAFAYGQGLPWGEIWPTAANASPTGTASTATATSPNCSPPRWPHTSSPKSRTT